MHETSHLSSLQKALNAMKPTMLKFQGEHHAFKFQFAVGIVFHKSADPAVVTHPPEVLTSEMATVCDNGCTASLKNANRQLLNEFYTCL